MNGNDHNSSLFPRSLNTKSWVYNPDEDRAARWDDKLRIATIYGTGEVIQFHDREQFIKETTEHRLFIYVSSFEDFSVMEDLEQDPRVNINYDKDIGVVSIFYKSKFAAQIVNINSWFDRIRIITEFHLAIIVGVWKLTGFVGATPGAVGEHILISTLKVRYSRPSVQLRKFLFDHCIGARSDLFHPFSKKKVWELDRKSAYHDSAKWVPDVTSAPIHFWKEEFVKNYPHYFALIRFTNPQDLPVGVLPIRGNKNRVIWTTEPGKEFETVATKQQIELARHLGVKVDIVEGFAWEKSSDFLQKYIGMIMGFRATAHEMGDVMEGMIKRVGLATYGRMLMRPVEYKKVKLDDMVGDVDYIPIANVNARPWENELSDYGLVEVPDPEMNKLTQVGFHIIYRNQLMLSQRILEEMMTGNEVLGTNVDAVYIRYPSVLPTGTNVGQWKATVLRQSTMQHLRHIQGISESGETIDHRPGVPLKRRQ